jgi:hypothetical protein
MDNRQNKRAPGRPSLPEESRRRPMTISLGPEAIENLKAEAKRRGVSQGELVEVLLGHVRPRPVQQRQAFDAFRVDRLIDAIFTIQQDVRSGNVELGAMDRNGIAPVQAWLVALRNDLDKVLK